VPRRTRRRVDRVRGRPAGAVPLAILGRCSSSARPLPTTCAPPSPPSGVRSWPTSTAPIGALDPRDIPALLAHVENEAAAEGATNLYFSTPLLNDFAVRHLLARGFTLDPFVVALLADDRSIKVDRWFHTGLGYIL
jgi:hypothetical protein